VEAVEEQHSSHEVAEAVAEAVVETVGVEVESWLFVAVQCLGSGGNIVHCRENLVLLRIAKDWHNMPRAQRTDNEVLLGIQ
jgi:hypothetical protein